MSWGVGLGLCRLEAEARRPRKKTDLGRGSSRCKDPEIGTSENAQESSALKQSVVGRVQVGGGHEEKRRLEDDKDRSGHCRPWPGCHSTGRTQEPLEDKCGPNQVGCVLGPE